MAAISRGHFVAVSLVLRFGRITICGQGSMHHPFLLMRRAQALAVALVLYLFILFGGAASQDQGQRGDGAVAGGKRGGAVEWVGTRRWVGPSWWADPSYDWSIKKGAVIGSGVAGRTLTYLPAEVVAGVRGRQLTARVTVQLRASPAVLSRIPPYAFAGFRLGRQADGKDDFRRAVVYPARWVDAGINGRGALVLAGRVSAPRAIDLRAGRVDLSLGLTGGALLVDATLTARQGGAIVAKLTTSLSRSRIEGGVSLAVGGERTKPGVSPRVKYDFAFSDFALRGSMLREDPTRRFGPILWTQYTLSARTLRLQAQLAPFDAPVRAQLWVRGGKGLPGQWRQIASAVSDALSRTVVFTVPNWATTLAQAYEVRIGFLGSTHAWAGVIRREPRPQREGLRLGVFSCDNGYLFPQSALVAQVARQDPDMLLFLGDQIYESYGSVAAIRSRDVPLAMLDFIQKHSLFGWTWRELLRDRPSIILPDDHDVFQGNLFGHGGRRLPTPGGDISWPRGGYLMPGAWVSAVERVNAGHLPDPAVDITLPIGIKPYFTTVTYGGVGFAVLEDRKFKTGPLSLPFAAGSDPKFNAQLLGPQQEAFLAAWAGNWSGHVMKVAVSQTIFANAETHGGYSLERLTYILDSGAWPKFKRNEVVRLLGENNILSMHGDQHLGVLLKQGVDTFGDAGYAFMVPGTANGWPRAWWPGVPRRGIPKPGQDFTGQYVDDAGNPLTVLAVANPQPGSNAPLRSGVPLLDVGYRRGSGYGIVELDKASLSARFSLYRVGAANELFKGFPQTVRIGGQPSPRI